MNHTAIHRERRAATILGGAKFTCVDYFPRRNMQIRGLPMESAITSAKLNFFQFMIEVTLSSSDVGGDGPGRG